MVFNKTGRLLQDSNDDERISSVPEYCYLGIVITLNGSLITAQQRLRQKGLRSYFSIKSMIDIRSLKKTVLSKLFDALIIPVAANGCNIWLPETWIVRNTTEHQSGERLPSYAKDPLEQMHLSFLKWNLGTNKKTSNAALWGDSGRYPLAIVLSKQLFKYFDRLKSMDNNNNSSLITHAFRKQKLLNLTWFSRISDLHRTLQSQSATTLTYPSQIRAQFKNVRRYLEHRKEIK